MATSKSGLAFSGGGIRSAALCSGVLRRLLQDKAKVDYLSCVSGGGYTGTAFLDWKYRKEKKEDNEEEWYEEFFDRMRREAGYLCNWEKPLIGIRDTIVLFLLVLIVTFILPVIIYGSYSFPVAFIIDYIFGKYLRDKVDCNDTTTIGTRMHQSDQNATAQELRKHCLSRQGTMASTKIVLFSTLGVFFVIFYILSQMLSEKFSKYFSFLSAICFLFFSFTFLPFALHAFFISIPLWSRLVVVVVVVGVVLWFFLPLLRNKTSYGLIIYIYSYIIYWKVYEGKIIGIPFSVELFNKLLFTSGLVLWFVPYLNASRERLIHVYNRWRLQKAFYSKESRVRKGWLERFQEVFCPLWTCLKKRRSQRSRQHTKQQADIDRNPDLRSSDPIIEGTEPTEKSFLKLADLSGVDPEYISNVTIHSWKKDEDSDRDYGLLTMSPTAIERLDHDVSAVDHFKGKLDPGDVELSDAMATSAAAISGYDKSLEMVRLHTLLGMEMGTTMISNFTAIKNESCFTKVIPLLVNILRGLPLVVLPAIYYYGVGETSITVGVIIFFVIHLILAFIGAFADRGTNNPKWWDKIAGWLIVHVSFVDFVRKALSMDDIGPVPPPVMLLSDGGHVENLGILPLLKKKLKKIIVVDGGQYSPNDETYGHSLLKAMMLARTKLNCSFIGEGGRDVISDLLENLVKPRKPNERKPRHYKFRVDYFQDDVGKVGEGEILYIRPRDPQKGEENEVKTWEEFGLDLEPRDWGDSPYLTEEEVDNLTFCCCACCNNKPCLSGLSNLLCDKFPNHSTANQFFTPLMFSSYHREGFRACFEADAAEFLKDGRGASGRNSEFDQNIDV